MEPKFELQGREAVLYALGLLDGRIQALQCEREKLFAELALPAPAADSEAEGVPAQ